ncbi:MAG: hypothetical protein IPK15_25840, partial [Verrucomicrobia bacterium]|nr:hypothetical protein [Verrucomicrobiota bacterium]
MNSFRPSPRHTLATDRSAFSMIEMIGVIAIMAIAAAVIMPNLAQRMSRQNGEKEDKMLDVLGEGLTRYVQTYQVIPGANTWISSVASVTGLTTNEVRRVMPADSSTARVYLIHPSFTPSSTSGGTFADPLWSQVVAGASAVTSPRILIISVHKPGLTLPVTSGKASSASAFDAIWDWVLDPSTEAPPSGWSSSWTGNGEFLHVERINLTPLFHRVTINNSEFPDSVPIYSVGSVGKAALDSDAAMDAYFIANTLLRFYKDDDNNNDLDISHSLTGTANFIYEGSQCGACLDRENRGGYAGLAIIVVLAALTTVGVLLAPNLIKSRVQARQFSETRQLEQIADQLIRSIRSKQYIPGPTNWSVTLAEYTGQSQTAIEQVYPEFPSDTTTRRVMLLDPAIGKGALPYAQGVVGLEGALTNLAGPGSRGLLISSTRRGLSLPVSTGLANSTSEFDAIWNWSFDPATKAPPSGWPSTWKGFGEELHVARINFANLFHTVRMNNLLLVVETNRVSLPIQAKADLSALKEILGGLKGPLEQVTQLITTPTEMKVLDGTLLKIYETNGTFAQARRITSDVGYEFEVTNAGPPVVHFKFLEGKGAVATNSGSYGSAWDSVYTNGVTLGVNEPVPPAFPSFETNNNSVYFDGNKSYVETGEKLTNIS